MIWGSNYALSSLACCAVLALATTDAQAVPVGYNFEFNSGDGLTITGMFEAEPDGALGGGTDGFFDLVEITMWSGSGGPISVVDVIPDATPTAIVAADGSIAGLDLRTFSGLGGFVVSADSEFALIDDGGDDPHFAETGPDEWEWSITEKTTIGVASAGNTLLMMLIAVTLLQPLRRRTGDNRDSALRRE